MKTRLILLALLGAALCFGQSQYVYDWSCAWSNPGACGAAYAALSRFENSGYGSYVFASSPVSGNANDYEIRSQLAIKYGGETYIHYLRSSSGNTNYISAEIVIPANFQTTGTATLLIDQSVNGTVTQLASTSVNAADGMTFRTVVWSGNLWVFLNNLQVLVQAIPVTTGYPGFGGAGLAVSSGDAFTTIQIGHHDTVAPHQISAQSVATSILPYAASFRWQGVQDDSIGIGVFQYVFSRNGTQIAMSQAVPSFTDATVQPSTAYTYTLQAMDYHGNLSTPTTVNITTPPIGAVDPRRTGVYSTGSYWGGGGEQIDTLSGNLNFSVPLVTPQGRTGWAVSAGLAYNSQNWRQDNGVNWQLGDDVGYGFGWKLLIGSVTPYYASTWSGVDHYVYTDSTGAEYRLDQNNNGVWSSKQGIFVWFNANNNVLHFKDGKFWVMGCTSGGAEPDAGTMYPTIIEDVSANQVVLNYQPGAGLGSAQMNTSARINIIQDVRATQCPQTFVPNTVNCATYTFAYNTDSPVPHLISVTNPLETSENYNLGYSNNASLGPPFGSDPNFAGMTTTHLATLSVVSANQYQFTYDTAGAGELTQVTFPFGGHLRWSYISDAFNGSRFLRAVGTRYLAADSAGATEWSYPITRDNASGATLHAWMSLADASGIGSKTWSFITSTGAPAWQLGLMSELLQKPSLNSNAILQDDTYTWSQEPVAGNPYISAKTTVKDEGSANQQSALTTQAIDQYGNVTQLVTYPYNNTSSPLQTYTNTYLTASAYTSNYIFNRLATTTITTGGTTTTLVQNSYDARGQVTVNNQSFAYGDWQLHVPRDADPAPPVPYGSRGELVSTTTPVHTTWMQLAFGGISGTAPTDGQTVTMNSGTDTNYAAPDSIATQTYSQSLAYNAWLGVTQTTGANGEALSMTYDSIGRPATGRNYWAPVGSGFPPTYTYTYSAANATPVTQTKTGPDGVTITTMDGLGRIIRVQRGDSANVDSTTSYADTVYEPCACSPLAKIQQVSQPYAPGGTPAWTVYTYDGLGRAVSVRQPDGASTTNYVYSGNQTTVTDPAGHWKQFTSDVQGNLTTVVEPDPANPPSGTLATSYSYDWMNHVTQVTMPRGGTTQTRTFTYNSAGLLTSATNPENGTVSYTYNADNTLQYKQDAKGQQTVYTYDSYKRVTETRVFPSGQNNPEDLCQRANYIWDYSPNGGSNLGRIGSAYWGAVNSAGNPCIAGSQATYYSQLYNYYPNGQLWNKTLQMYFGYVKQSVEVNYYYNVGGLLSNVAYPLASPFAQTGTPVGNVSFAYSYDSMGRPVSLTDNHYSWNWAQGAQYDVASRLTSVQYIAGAPGGTPGYTTETMAYNTNGQMVSQNWSTASSLGPTGGLLYSYAAAGQNNGQITQTSDTLSGETISYQYDALKRLTSASSTPQNGTSPTAWTQTFQFDGFGNLTAKVLNGTTAPIAVNAATNQLSNASYDLNGNMISGVGATLTYDASNRMISAAEVSGGTEYYGYSPDNKRIDRLTASGTEEWTFYGGYGEKLGVFQYSVSGGLFPVRSNVQFAGRTIIDNNYPVFQDRLGTNRASGARFRPYGDEITSTANDREKFGTYTRDSYTGLDYADQRFYASTYGRFNTADPYMASAGPSDPGSWNRYAYTRGDPVNRMDPRGTCDLMVSFWIFNDGWSPFSTSCDASLGSNINPAALTECFAVNTCLANFQAAQGGGGGNAQINVTKFSTTSIQAVTVQNDLRWLQQAIQQDPTCSGWLQGSYAGINYMLNVPGSGATMMAVGVGNFPAGTNAVAGITGTNLPAGELITVALNGGFFNAGPSSSVGFGLPAWITGGSNAAQAEILLHELAHNLVPNFLGDGPLPNGQPNVNAQTINNTAVMQNCGNVVALAAGMN